MFQFFISDKNVFIFGVENSSSVLAANNKRYILVLGEVPTIGLDDTTITAEASYSINFSRSNRKFCFSLYCNRSNFFHLIMLQKYIISEQKIQK